MVETDLLLGDQLRALAGWNQTMEDWRRWWSYQPRGCFVGEWNGQSVGTATTTSYGNEVAWIGMVLVHPDFRRRGIASALLRHCLDFLSSIRAVELDATPLGKPLYEQLGFVEKWALTRWERPGVGERLRSTRSTLDRISILSSFDAADRTAIHTLDARAFGIGRARLLDLLMDQTLSVLVSRERDGRIDGFGLVREGSRARYLGPIASTNPGNVRPLVERALDAAGDRPIYWDIPDANVVSVEIARDCGFRPQRPLLRMCRGSNDWPENLEYYYGIADPAVG